MYNIHGVLLFQCGIFSEQGMLALHSQFHRESKFYSLHANTTFVLPSFVKGTRRHLHTSFISSCAFGPQVLHESDLGYWYTIFI